MSDKYDATIGEFIDRSLGHIECGRLTYFEISYYAGNKEINITIESKKKTEEQH